MQQHGSPRSSAGEYGAIYLNNLVAGKGPSGGQHSNLFGLSLLQPRTMLVGESHHREVGEEAGLRERGRAHPRGRTETAGPHQERTPKEGQTWTVRTWQRGQ